MADTIEQDKVVKIHYRLTNDAGDELDKSHDDEPLMYLHGHGNIVEGLEEALAGKAVGDEVKAVVSPEKGYGVRQGKPQKVPRSAFEPGADLHAGMQVMGRDDKGRPFPMWIVKVLGNDIVLDSNHPLAGETLHFEVKIDSLRDATDEEIAHGHAHGPHGHGHHH